MGLGVWVYSLDFFPWVWGCEIFITSYISLWFLCVTLVEWVYTHVIHIVGSYLYLCAGWCWFAIGIWYERGGSGVGVTLGLSGVTIFLGRHTGLSHFQIFNFFPDITFTMCLVITYLWSCVWEFTWHTLCRRSLRQNPLISHCRQSYPGSFWTLCPDKLISSLVSLSFHSLSVDAFWTLDTLLFLDFFLEDCSLCSLLLGPLGVFFSVALNVLNIGDSGPGW